MKTEINWHRLEDHLAVNNRLDLGVLSEFKINFEILYPLRQIPTHDRPYGRRILHSSQNCEIMLATWNPGLECAPHDHGQSTGWVWFCKGNFIESQFHFDKNLAKVNLRAIEEDTIISIERGGVHSCMSEKGGLSLHIYMPPIEGMKVYDMTMQMTYSLKSTAGAWLPVDSDTVIAKEHW